MTFKRICNECGKELKAGFVIDGGTEYYCSEKCLHKHYTHEEYLELYDDGNGDTYWTEWEEDENGERTKTPDYGTILNIRDAAYVGGILTNETRFNNWVLNLKKGVNHV